MENNENSKPKVNKSIFRPNKVVALLIYVLFMFVVGTILMYLITYIFSKTNNVNYNDLMKAINKSKEGYDANLLPIGYAVQGVCNFITYLLSLILVLFYTRDSIKDDFMDLINRRRTLSWLIPVMALAFTGIAFLIDLGFNKLVSSSNNQNTIVDIISSPAGPIMILCTVLFAPVLEELVYRKCIFSLVKDRVGIVWCYIISIVAFSLPHMLSTPVDNVGTWFLQSIPYVLSAFMLCGIYHLSKFNIYSVILAHMFNNILAVILVFGGQK